MFVIKSRKIRNLIGMDIIYPDGSSEPIARILMPPDGDFRADIEFYDDLEKIYKKRLSKWVRYKIK